MAEREATLRAAWLGQYLRTLRNDAGLTVREVGVAYGRHHGTVSRIETGIQPAKNHDVLGYLKACGITDPDKKARLLNVVSEVNERGWWDGYKDSVSGTLIDRLWLEDRATGLRSYETIILPGLLQTPSYAEELIRIDSPGSSNSQIKSWLNVRMQRQHILTRHTPTTLTAIIDGSVLSRPVGPHGVMRDQLNHLLKVAKYEHIQIHILPNSAGYCGSAGAFVLLDLIEPYPRVAFSQTPLGDVCVEGEHVRGLESRFSVLMDHTFSIQESLDVITEVRDRS